MSGEDAYEIQSLIEVLLATDGCQRRENKFLQGSSPRKAISAQADGLITYAHYIQD